MEWIKYIRNIDARMERSLLYLIEYQKMNAEKHALLNMDFTNGLGLILWLGRGKSKHDIPSRVNIWKAMTKKQIKERHVCWGCGEAGTPVEDVKGHSRTKCGHASNSSSQSYNRTSNWTCSHYTHERKPDWSWYLFDIIHHSSTYVAKAQKQVDEWASKEDCR